MKKEKIALIVDSGCNLNNHLIDGTDIKSIPLRVLVDDKDYTDGVDINLEGVFEVLDTHKVTTSLPSGKDILAQLEGIHELGYTHAFVVTISSGLSGTYNVVQNLSQDIDGMTIEVIDTKNISVGSGLVALEIDKRIQRGDSFETIKVDLQKILDGCKVFFTIGTLDYLRRGGRIGLVAGTVANVLNIKPIITCNEDGIYHTVSKIRGFSRAIKSMVDQAELFANGQAKKIILLEAGNKVETPMLLNYVKEKFPNVSDIEIVKVSPALGIHVGPDAFGIGVSII